MSSRATATSSFTQMYCCFNRDPQVLCSRLNEMARLASVAEKSFTGIETIPNETVSVAIDRAAMLASELVPPFQGVRAAILRLRALERTLDRHEHVESRLAGGFHDCLQPHARKQFAQPERHFLSFFESDRVQLGLVPRGLLARVDVGIDVENDVIGIVEDRALERGERT